MKASSLEDDIGGPKFTQLDPPWIYVVYEAVDFLILGEILCSEFYMPQILDTSSVEWGLCGKLRRK